MEDRQRNPYGALCFAGTTKSSGTKTQANEMLAGPLKFLKYWSQYERYIVNLIGLTIAFEKFYQEG